MTNCDIGRFDSTGLLQLDERNHFNDGHARYFQHVMNVFEKAGAMSYVADFANLALGSLGKAEEVSKPVDGSVDCRQS